MKIYNGGNCRVDFWTTDDSALAEEIDHAVECLAFDLRFQLQIDAAYKLLFEIEKQNPMVNIRMKIVKQNDQVST